MALFNFSKSKKKEAPIIEDDLTDDQKQMLNHIAEYRKRSGREIPAYEEMLKLSKEEFQTWLFFRVQKPNRNELLAEMIEHEEKTGSFGKESKERISELLEKEIDSSHLEFAQGIFKKDNKQIIQILEDENVAGDEIRDSIFAKAMSDYMPYK
jgi:Mg2+ and Co2+ transporter CorA